MPDILVVGKAIGGGLPVAAVVTTEAVETMALKRMGRHVHSHMNDPLSGAAAAAVIGILQEERLVDRAAEMGDYLRTGLERLAARHGCFAGVRGRGLMQGLVLQSEAAARGPEMAARLLADGFILDFHVPSGTFRLFPPYVITRAEIDSFIEAMERTAAE